MPSRKKAYVLLRGVLSGLLIVGGRAWYERERVAKGRLWKQLQQSDDYEMLVQMAKLGNKPNEPLFEDHYSKMKGNKC
jgi:hypothetical protein